MKYIYKLFLILVIVFFSGCGGNNELILKGEPEAIAKAQAFMDAMGGAKAWRELKSVYIRTITTDISVSGSFISEEWMSLDEPKFIIKKTTQSWVEVQILNKNDGWIIKDKKVSLMPNNGITQLLKWRDNFFMTNVKRLAVGAENYEVKLNGDDGFDFYIGDVFKGGFKLNDKNLPDTYTVSVGKGRTSAMIVEEWGMHKGLAYPLIIKAQNTMSLFKTEYWDPSKLEAEKAFKISFNPNEMIDMQ